MYMDIMSFIAFVMIVALFIYQPGVHDIFRSARIGCNYLKPIPTDELKCELLSKGSEVPKCCNYYNCPIRKGRI